MRSRWTLALTLALALGALAPRAARAEQLGGSFGLGADSALGLAPEGHVLAPAFTLPGLAATYYLTDFLGLQLIAAFQLDDGNLAGEDETVMTLGLAGRVLVPFIREEGAHLSGFGGVALAMVDEDREMPNRHTWRFGFELGVRPEWLLTEYFSVHTQIGVAFALWERDPGMGMDRSGWALDLFGNANLLGNAGFTFFF